MNHLLLGPDTSIALLARAALVARGIVAALVAAFALPVVSAAQCFDQGSLPIAAAVQAGPVPLGCAAAPSWPQWHTLTPPHRAPAPRPGFDPGDAHALPRLLVLYRCTGWLLLPVVPNGVRTMGYVIDRPERACARP